MIVSTSSIRSAASLGGGPLQMPRGCNRSPDPMARRPARVLSRSFCGLRRNVLLTVVAGNSAGSVPKDRLQGRCEDPKSLEPPRSSNASHFAPGDPSPDAGTPLQSPLSQSEVPVLSTRRNAFAADDVPGSCKRYQPELFTKQLQRKKSHCVISRV